MQNFARNLGDLAGQDIVLWRKEIIAFEKRFEEAPMDGACDGKVGWLDGLRTMFGLRMGRDGEIRCRSDVVDLADTSSPEYGTPLPPSSSRFHVSQFESSRSDR